MPQARKQKKRLEPPPPPDMVEVEVGWQTYSAFYDLDYPSEELIQAAYPDAKILDRLVVRCKTREDLVEQQRPLWPQIAVLLTGLSLEQLARLGGYRIVEPWPRKVLWEWKPAAVNAG